MKAEFDARLLSGRRVPSDKLAKDRLHPTFGHLASHSLLTITPRHHSIMRFHLSFLCSLSLLACLCFLLAQAAPAALRTGGDAQLLLTAPTTGSKGRQRFNIVRVEL